MKTRNADTPKSATTAKKTPPAKKSASKTPPNPTKSPPESAATPKSTETKRVSATKPKQVKTTDTTSSALKPEPAVEQAKASVDDVQVTPEPKKAVSGIKTTRTVVKKIVVRRKTPTSAKAVSSKTLKSGEAGKGKIEGSAKKKAVVDAKDVESAEKKEHAVENVEGSTPEHDNVANAKEPTKKEEAVSDAQPLTESVGNRLEQEDSVVTDAVKSSKNQEPNMSEEEDPKEEMKEETKIIKDTPGLKNKSVSAEEEELKGEDVPPKEDVYPRDERMEEYDGQEVDEEFGEEDLAEDNALEHGEEADALEEEHAELTALARERKIKKELEIFVGGLERDAAEEDVKKVFENVGEVVEVRLHKNPSTNKNKGYAFVKFATKEQASRALSEMKNPVICGKRCGTAPSEDNDTLFLGNVCNTWTKEAIKQKLKDYGIEGIENITLVPDAQHEGLSRGFAFLEFLCHADAMLAYKRLQKPDVIFGHSERTAKVAFAEPLREPDPEVMAQVKSVFVDGLPPHWDEDHVRKLFKGYGEIERIMLARNMSTAKRKDFGFVDFTTHEAAVACIDDVNYRELGDGKSKTKVKVRLSNPLPKTQAVKGGMCGGFRIGRGSGGNFQKFGRGFGQGGHPFNRANFQRGRGFYHHDRGQTGRVDFANEHDLDGPYPPFRGRQNFGRGGRWGSYGGAHQASGAGTGPARYNLDRPRHGATDRARGRHMPLRGQPFFPEEEFNRPFVGRHFDDPYFYDDSAHGIKRPLFPDQNPDYVERSRVRPRLDYSDPAVSRRGTHYRDTFGAGSDRYSRDYYGSDYGGGAYYGGDRPYGGGYYY